MKIKEALSKFWFIVWKDESPKGWLISFLFIFIFIKFIFFPVLSFATGSALPLAIVESCSMYHDGNLISNFDNWWEYKEENYSPFSITKSDFEDFIFKRGFNKGDILFIVGVDPKDVKIGDVLIFNANYKNPLIHRVVEVREENGNYVYSTMGDNNQGQLVVEKNIKPGQIVGKAVFKVAPYLGWAKLIFFEPQRSSSERGFCSQN